MKATTFKAAVLAGSLGLIAGSASGQGLSDPVGYYTKTFAANSDTSLGLGLLRPEFGSVTITTVTGNDAGINETLTANELDAPGGVTGTSVELVYQGDVVGNTYMLLVTSGPKLGAYYPIATNGANAITLDYLGDTVGTDLDGQSGKIIPMWDLNTLFPSGAGLNATTAIPFNGSRIFFTDLASAGVNQPPAAQYVFIDGIALAGNAAFTGFYDGATAPTGPADKVNVVIFPDEFLIVRNDGVPETSLTVTGDVLVDSVRIGLMNQGDPLGQDIPAAVPYPVDLTLNSLNLAGVPELAFKNTTAIPFNGDRLFIFDDPAIGFNKPPANQYVHIDGVALAGNAAFTNWYDGASTPTGPGDGVGDIAGLAPANTGLIIRKTATSGSGDWIFNSPYTP